MIKWISETLKWCEKEPEQPVRLYPKKESNFAISSPQAIIIIIGLIIISLIIITACSRTCMNESGMLRNYLLMGA